MVSAVRSFSVSASQPSPRRVVGIGIRIALRRGAHCEVTLLGRLAYCSRAIRIFTMQYIFYRSAPGDVAMHYMLGIKNQWYLNCPHSPHTTADTIDTIGNESRIAVRK